MFWGEESGRKGGCRCAVEVCRVFAAALSWCLRPNAAARLLLLPLLAAAPPSPCCGAEEFTDEFNTENRFKIDYYPAVFCFVFFMQRPQTQNWNSRTDLSEPQANRIAVSLRNQRNFKEVALRATTAKPSGIASLPIANVARYAFAACANPPRIMGILSELLMSSYHSSSVKQVAAASCTLQLDALLMLSQRCPFKIAFLVLVCAASLAPTFVSGRDSYLVSDGPTEVPLAGAPLTKFYCRTLPAGSIYASPNPFTGFSGRGVITTQVRMSAHAIHYEGNSSNPTSGNCISSWNRLAGLSRCGFSLAGDASRKSWFAWRTHEECVLKDSVPNSNLTFGAGQWVQTAGAYFASSVPMCRYATFGQIGAFSQDGNTTHSHVFPIVIGVQQIYTLRIRHFDSSVLFQIISSDGRTELASVTHDMSFCYMANAGMPLDVQATAGCPWTGGSDMSICFSSSPEKWGTDDWQRQFDLG